VWRLAEADRACRLAGVSLRKVIWDPLAPRLAGAERVLIVPDAAINLVPFAALPVESRYLIERGPLIHYLSAERDLVAETSETAMGDRTHGLLAIGAPDFDLGPDRAGKPYEAPLSRNRSGPPNVRRRSEPCGDFVASFGELPSAKIEAQWIAKRWNAQWGGAGVREVQSGDSAICLTGAAATEDAFKHFAPGKRVLHLATHGFYLGIDCPSPAAAQTASSGASSRTGSEPSPPLLGGLALAGANRRRAVRSGVQDGVLTAEEIAGLDLDHAEWTVLSACNTGIGDVHAGEGVFGLRRAFEVAGCRRLIVSLWPVGDQATLEWMRALYAGRFERGLDTAAAVRDASLELLKEARARGGSTHPCFWAGFIAAGDWR